MVNLVFSVLSIAVLFASADKPGTCNFSNIPAQENFDIKRFYGSWYEDGRTEFQWGDNTTYSAGWTWYEATNGTIFFSYNGYFPHLKACSEPKIGFANVTAAPSKFILVSEAGKYEFIFQVAYTDYNHIALVYICYKEVSPGICLSNHIHTAFMTRHSPLTKPQIDVLNCKLDQVCVTNNDVILAPTGLCLAPCPNPTLIG